MNEVLLESPKNERIQTVKETHATRAFTLFPSGSAVVLMARALGVVVGSDDDLTAGGGGGVTIASSDSTEVVFPQAPAIQPDG